MSYSAYLTEPETGATIQLKRTDAVPQPAGGIMRVSPVKYAELNITFNYGAIFRRFFGEEGIRKLNGMRAASSMSLLVPAIDKLKDDVDPDYWRATEGNAKRALQHLRTLAELRPDGIWKIN